MKKHISLPSISRVVPGSTAILELPLGPTYEYIHFTASGTALAASHITGLRLLVDGQEKQRYKDLQRLIDLNAYYARSTDAVTDFMLHLKRDEYDDPAYRQVPAFGTANLQTLTIEVDIAAGAPANIAMSAIAYIDTQLQDLGVFTQIRETSLNSAVAGDVDFDKLLRNGAVYQAIHLFKADVNRVLLEIDQNKWIDASKGQLERIQKTVRPNARVPLTAKATHIDFLTSGLSKDLLDTTNIQDLRLRMNLGTSGAIEIVTEQFEVYKP